MAKKLDESFFERKPQVVAKDLIGRVLIHKIDSKEITGIIQETFAYCKDSDNITQNYSGMSQNAGGVYIFDYRGNKFLNVTTSYYRSNPSCVHISKLIPIQGTGSQKTDGPGKLTKTLKIPLSYNGIKLSRENLWIEGDGVSSSSVREVRDKKKRRADVICLGHYHLI